MPANKLFTTKVQSTSSLLCSLLHTFRAGSEFGDFVLYVWLRIRLSFMDIFNVTTTVLKKYKKSNMAATWQFFGHKLALKHNFQNRYKNLWNATQDRYIPNLKSLACLLFKCMYLLWVFSFAIWIFWAFCIYRKIRFYKIIITQARNNIFHADFCIFYILTRYFKINKLVFGPAPCGLNLSIKIYLHLNLRTVRN